MLVWFGEQPLDGSRRYLVKHSTRTVPATLEQILWRKDLENLTEVPAETLALNDIGKVRLVCQAPAALRSLPGQPEHWRLHRHRRAHARHGGGGDDPRARRAMGAARPHSSSRAQERRERLGQQGEVVLLPDSPEAEERALPPGAPPVRSGPARLGRPRRHGGGAGAGGGRAHRPRAHRGSPQARRALRAISSATRGWTEVELEASADLDGWVRQLLAARSRTAHELAPSRADGPRARSGGFAVVSAMLGEERGALLLQPGGGADARDAALAERLLSRASPPAGPRSGGALPRPRPCPSRGSPSSTARRRDNSRCWPSASSARPRPRALGAPATARREYPVRELPEERLLYVVISTQGDGDPPDDSRGFVEFLLGKQAPKLEQLRFAVLGLGDSSYPKYCEIGRVLDARLAELGATRLLDRADCDVDFEPVATGWLDQAVGQGRRGARSQGRSRRSSLQLRAAALRPPSTQGGARTRPSSSPTSASPGAARSRTCGTSSCRSGTPD